MAQKGRRVRGEGFGSAKLTDALVREIRKSAETDREISERLGLAESVISRTRVYKLWSHIQPDPADIMFLDANGARRPCGSRHFWAVLTEDQVREIRKMRGTDKAIAGQFGVSVPCISKIRLGRTWRHIL